MSAGFAKGPWCVGGPNGHNVSNIYAENHAVATVFGVPIHTDADELEVLSRPMWAMGLANANLIAAAPCMFEALVSMRHRWELYTGGFGGAGHTDDALMALADAAIAKARGEA